MAKPWRLAAGLAAAAVVLALVLQGAEFWRLRRADAALDDVLAAACQRVVGDSSTSGCQREIRQRLGSSASSATEDFLSTLAAVAGARNAEMQIDALSYRNRVMDLQLLVPDVVTLEDFSRALEQTRRFEVEIETANRRDDATEGRLRIAGANP
jgi:hypothetical protein